MSDSDSDDARAASFDESFDVSHISHADDDDDEQHVSSAVPHVLEAAPASQTEHQSRHAAASGWFASEESTYDAFIKQQQQQQHLSSFPAKAAAPASPPASLSEERARLRERKSIGGGSGTQVAEAAAAVQAVSAQTPSVPTAWAAASAPSAGVTPFIPKLALGLLTKQEQPASSPQDRPSASPPALSSRPSTAHPSGASTTRSRLSAFNSKLRAARRIQSWYRNMRACADAKAEVRARRAERAALQRAEESHTDPTRRLAFDGEKKQPLAHLKQKLAARSNGSETARPATAAPLTARSSVGSSRSNGAGAAAVAAPRSFPAHAAPALRALLQGFMVRHIMSQRSVQELVTQIRDVDILMADLARERASGSKYDAGFHRSVAAQRTALKEKLSAALHASPPASGQHFAGIGLSSPSRIKFSQRSSSPQQVHLDGGENAHAMLKRKTVRRYLKKKEPAPLPISTRPATAAAAQVSASASPPAARSSFAPPPALSAWDDSSIDQSQYRDDPARPATAVAAAAAAGGGGSQTARTFLKRTSKKQPAQKLDWSGVRPKVDNKLEGSYQPNSIYDSVTGREWDERDRMEQGLGGAGGLGSGHAPAHPSHSSVPASVASSHAALPSRIPPPPLHMDRPRKSAGSGSQTARESSSSYVAPAPRKAFKPAGNASTALPIVANTDSGAPPLSPPATARTLAKKSRHINLKAQKMDLSRVKARIDDSSPYKAANPAGSTPDGSGDDGGGIMRGGVSPPRRKSGNAAPVGVIQPRFAPHTDNLSARAQAARAQPMRSGVTPTREELRRLDEELAREQAQLQAEMDAWESHAVRPTSAISARRATKSLPAPVAPVPHDDINASVDASHAQDDSAEQNARLMRQLELELEYSAPRVSQRPASASPVHAHHVGYTPESWDASASASPPADSSARPGRIRSSRQRLSHQDQLINAEIEDIERSLQSMSAFARPRGARAQAYAEMERQQQQQQQAARPQTAAASLHSFSAGIDAATHAIMSHDDLPSEWKRTVPSSQSAIPLYQPPPQQPPHLQHAFSAGSPRAAAGAAVLSPRASAAQPAVMHLTAAYDQLSADVADFLGQPQQ